MAKYKKNTVKLDIGSYIHYWRGIKKSGKTTLFYNLLMEQYGTLDAGLLISVGEEIGFYALDGIIYVEVPTWEDLIELVDDLVENKADNNFKFLGIDTVDELVKLAKEEVKRLHKKAKGVAAEFNACLGGYGAPRDKVIELIDEQLARLRRAGYGLALIGHTKLRDVKEKNGDEYQQLTSNLSSDYDGIFANKADIVMTIAVEKNIDEHKRIEGTTRYMYFRTDGFIDAGGRFDQMPERVEYGARNYIEAFEQGVRGAMKTNKLTEEQIAQKRAEEVQARENVAADFANESKELADKDTYMKKIKENFMSSPDATKKQAKSMLTGAGYAKFDEADVQTLKAIAALF